MARAAAEQGRGVVVKLSAIALSIKPGASARNISIAGGLITHGAGITPLELHGTVDSIRITEGLTVARWRLLIGLGSGPLKSVLIAGSLIVT